MTTLDPYVATIGRLPAIAMILDVVTQTTGMRFAAVARVTDRQWITCASRDDIAFGLKPGDELPLETTICNDIRQQHRAVVFADASVDPTFAGHATPRLYGFRSYISVPIFRKDGEFFGTLCAIDPDVAPALNDPRVLKTIELFAQLVGAHLDLEDRVERSETALSDAQSKLELRDQFVAVLGHDLRAPLRTVSVGAEMLRRKWPNGESPPALLGTIQTACRRMASLVDDILDFARGSLGGGIPIVAVAESPLADEIEHVVEETRLAHPGVAIHASLAMLDPVVVDRKRIGQLLGNLLNNAIAHGDATQPVTVQADTRAGMLAISVSNFGVPISRDVAARLFQPFARQAKSDRAPEGLGLGLYIASEIARGHGAALAHRTHDGRTTFTFTMPLKGR